MSCIMKNPLISKKMKYTIDDETFEFTPKNLKTHFDNVYVFCKFNNDVDYQNILDGEVNVDNFKEIIKMFTLYEANISLIYNKVLNSNIIIMNSDMVKESNYFGYNLPEIILLLPIFNISFLHIQTHIDNITSNIHSFDKFYNEIVIKKYLNYEFVGKDIYNIVKMIKGLDIDEYWNTLKNCNLNINKEFHQRQFDYVPYSCKKSGIIATAMAKTNKNADYFDDVIDTKINKFMKKEEESPYYNKYYYSKEGSKYSNEDINSLFVFIQGLTDDGLTNDDYLNQIRTILFNLFCKLYSSRDYCHHILNNKYFLTNFTFTNNLFKNNFMGDNYRDIFIKNFKYAWTRFYMEEIAKEGYLNTDDEIVFDIHTANKLPVFILKTVDKINNPYFVIPISKNIIINNIEGVDYTYYHNGNSNLMGVVDLKTFKQKMNTFISGSELFDVFYGIDFKKNKMVITGSIMPACLHRNNPLRLKFETDYRYYAEYYCNSDVDVMIKTNSVTEFLDIVDDIYNKISQNIKTYFEYFHLKIEYNKNVYVYLTKKFIEDNLSEYDFEFVKENINSDEIITKMLPYIEDEHVKYISSLNLSDDKLKLVSEFDKSKVNIILYENQKDNYDDITIRFNLKVKVQSKYLSRELEIFMIKGNDFMNIVSKFHLPCVRAYYDGDNVYMTPTCITAYMTMMNMHYTYFSSATTPMEIINKYRMRGFGTILNKKEIRELFKYSCDNEYWRNLYGFTDVSQVEKNMKNFLKYKNHIITNSFYEPRKTNYAYYLNNDYVECEYIDKHPKNNNTPLMYFNGIASNICFSIYKSYDNGNLNTINSNLNTINNSINSNYNTSTDKHPQSTQGSQVVSAYG